MKTVRSVHRSIAPVAMMVAVLCLADLRVRPEAASLWLGSMGTMAGFWLVVGWMTRSEPTTAIERYRRAALVRSAILAGCFLAVGLGLPLLRETSIGAGSLPDRVYGIAGGLLLVSIGNWIPKEPLPPNVRSSAIAWAIATRRSTGWTFASSGLACIAIWTIAPVTLAQTLANTVLGTAVAVVVGRYVLRVATTRRD